MYSSTLRIAAREMLASGAHIAAVSRALGVNRSTIRSWRDNPEQVGRHECPQCDGSNLDAESYALLLGFYLGDGCISRAARCHVLRVFCDTKYPGIIKSVAGAIQGVRSDARVFRVKAPGMWIVQASWVHWPCLFPQSSDGPKHLRSLVLADWQIAAVVNNPASFLRGLFHSDGSRTANWARSATGKRYDYPRWEFSNRSEDIHDMCQWALDLVGVEWKRTGWHTCVSKRDSVARLDELIGPKT